MSKKEKIAFNHDSQLTDIDGELDAALDGLSDANERVIDILAELDAPESFEEEAVPKESAVAVAEEPQEKTVESE